MSVVYEKRVRRAKRRQVFYKLCFTVVQSVSVGCSMIYYYWRSETSGSTYWLIFRSLLLIASLIAYTLWFTARIQLGNSLTLLAKTDGPFITTGLYSKFRNPIYLFGTISLSTYLLVIHKPKYLCLLFVLVPVQFVRAFAESNALRRKYDEKYEEYEKQVWI